MSQIRSTAEFSGIRVLGGKHGTRTIGKVLRAVFYPDDLRLAGFIVKRPDLLFMFKRSDRFFAWDSARLVDGRLVVYDEPGSWDKQACQRLGLDWESALILQGLPVIDQQGQQIGRIDAVTYDADSGTTHELLLSSSLGSKALVGQLRVSAGDLLLKDGSTLQLKPGVELPDYEGGLAAKAGEQAAVVGSFVKSKTEAAGQVVDKITEKAGQGMEELGTMTGQAIGGIKRKLASDDDEGDGGKTSSKANSKASSKKDANNGDGLLETGSRAVGRQIGRTRGMFKSFKDEYNKASKD